EINFADEFDKAIDEALDEFGGGSMVPPGPGELTLEIDTDTSAAPEVSESEVSESEATDVESCPSGKPAISDGCC
ncbi:MAG: hypothetical protein ACKVJL_05395, partial [Dehalococcoidia bacterium]